MPHEAAISTAVETAKNAAKRAGAILLEMRGLVNPQEKAPADLVTEADIASQRAILEIVNESCPDFAFLGEEDLGIDQEMDAEFCWIVDPLDGTTNYVHGLENYCVSIGLRQGDKIVAGIIYDPNRDLLYSAILGGGAYQESGNSSERLNTSRVTNLDQALVAASFSARVPRESPEIRRFIEVLVRCQALRRLGSAALNMCFVAAGKLDAYWATSVKAWDVAAGHLIVQEAGGIVTDLHGQKFDLSDPKVVAAATPELQHELASVLRM